jgi:hypothetical protein
MTEKETNVVNLHGALISTATPLSVGLRIPLPHLFDGQTRRSSRCTCRSREPAAPRNQIGEAAEYFRGDRYRLRIGTVSINLYSGGITDAD